MDNLNKNWLDDILGQQQEGKEITPDEQAVASAGLTHPDDLELERIVQETIAENWGSEFARETTSDDPDATQFFRPQQFHTGEIKDTGIGLPLTEEDLPASENSAEEAPGDISIDDILAFNTNNDITPAEEVAEPASEESSPVVDIFDDVLSEEALAEDEQPEQEASVKKTRPAKKKGYGLFGIPHILATGIWAALIIFIGVTLGKTVWLCAEDLLALGKTGQAVTITITADDTLADVAHKLETVGMIRYSSLFEAFAKLTGKGDSIAPGTIKFDAAIVYDYNALINAMSYKDGPSNTIEVTIPEGYTCKQIFALLEEKGVCSVKDLEEYAANGELSEYWFLEGVKRGSKYCLEGFLFPDTYEFYLDADPKSAIEKLLDGFDYRFSDELKAKYEKLNENLGLNLSFYEMVIMASMVQKEKATDLEGYEIASVFYNRMRKPSEYPVLNCDSTIVYAQDVYAGSTAIIESYDTYEIRGLPPTPISNPGLSSLDAALEPEETKYYYFVLNKETNRHVFAKTYSEHQKNLQELGYDD
ncbi:MAG: endolytic transglycosylase MltG [Oscillospiraceae bacterium]|nr:endolytic transglycosylase MltG [Oscillospiraceae bacterium]